MTRFTARRRCLRPPAAIVTLGLLTGCSGGAATSGIDSTSHPASAAPVTSAAAAVPTDAAAAAAVARATTLTRSLHSYAFRASQRVSGGARVQQTTVTGRAIRPSAVSYDVSVGGKVQQVIKVGNRTYVRVAPGGWKALAKPGPTADPVASLLPLLNGLTDLTLKGRTLRGQVPARVLSRAGLAPGGASSSAATPVTFLLDPAGRVISVVVRLTVKAGTQTLVLDEATSFTQFNTAAAIKPPGVVK